MTEFKIDITDTEETESKWVHLYFQSRCFLLKGAWQWNLHSQAICGSDVMHCLPAYFEGTKGLLHPDDVPLIDTHLQSATATPFDIQFRIITTYGKVEVLQGQAVVVTEIPLQDLPRPREEVFYLQQKQYKVQLEKLQPVLELAAKAEKYTGIGTWYFNTVTYAIYFSDNLYRLYGLPAQGVNAHLQSFRSFLHPQDAAAYNEAFEKAYQNRLPLHITYRIIDTLGEIKYLQLITVWHYNEKGEQVLSGVVTDQTAQKMAEAELEAQGSKNAFLKELIHVSESMTGIGTWQLNLLTRQAHFSDNFYRIFGLRPQVATLQLDGLVHFVHPEDRDLLTELNRQILFEQTCPETEFRMIRNDGKISYLQLRGKLMVHAKTDLIVAGTIQDITTKRLLEKKERSLAEELSAVKRVQQEVEAATNAYVWVTDGQTGKTVWSQNFYTLLGYKPHFVELTQKLFADFIHPDDKMNFADAVNLAEQKKLENSTHFRIITRGVEQHMKATFKPVEQDGNYLLAAIVQNVSGEVHLQQAQYGLQQLLAALQNTISEKVFVTDRAHTIIAMNEGGKKGLVRKGEEVLQKNIFEVFAQLKEVDYMAHLQDALNGKTVSLPVSDLTSHLRAGSYYLVPLADETGTVQHVLHVVQHKTAEQQWQQKATLYKKLVESVIRLMPGRVIVMDKHMNYVYWNEKCEAHYGIKKEDVIGKNILEFSPGFYDDPSYNEFKKTLSGEVISLTDRLGATDGYGAESVLIPVAEDNVVEYILWVVYEPDGNAIPLLDKKQQKGFETFL